MSFSLHIWILSFCLFILVLGLHVLCQRRCLWLLQLYPFWSCSAKTWISWSEYTSFSIIENRHGACSTLVLRPCPLFCLYCLCYPPCLYCLCCLYYLSCLCCLYCLYCLCCQYCLSCLYCLCCQYCLSCLCFLYYLSYLYCPSYTVCAVCTVCTACAADTVCAARTAGAAHSACLACATRAASAVQLENSEREEMPLFIGKVYACNKCCLFCCIRMRLKLFNTPLSGQLSFSAFHFSLLREVNFTHLVFGDQLVIQWTAFPSNRCCQRFLFGNSFFLYLFANVLDCSKSIIISWCFLSQFW